MDPETEVYPPHTNWIARDDGGYGGGLWTDPIPMDTIHYDGSRDLLYCHNGIWTPSGTFLRGCNVWGDFTPEGYQVSIYDAENDSWSVPDKLWSIFDDGDTFVGGYITQNQLVAGTEDNAFIVFCGQYGSTDLDAPVVGESSASSAMLDEPKVVTVEVTDNDWVDVVYFNWMKDAEGFDWEYTAEPDSTDTLNFDAEHNSGTYYFHLPNQVMDADSNMVDLIPGDLVLLLRRLL